jgi:hypothetical protein
MDFKPHESDWKTFRKRVPEWRERYLENRNREIAAILTNSGKTPTEQFWEAEKRIDEEAQLLVDLLDGHSRSKMFWYLMRMLGHGFIGHGDLEEFSEELRERCRKVSIAIGGSSQNSE